MPNPPCPCYSELSYADCCKALHAGQTAPSAERLMRARYSAYALKLTDYLQQSWHPSTRPDALTTEDLAGTKWLGLTILNAHIQDTNHATVEFQAKFRQGKAKTQTLHETSQFIQENGQWFYVDGVIHSTSSL